MTTLVCALLVLNGFLTGVWLGWRARSLYAPLPRCWALLCPDRATAALAWRQGCRIVVLDRHGYRELTPGEVQDALAERMRRPHVEKNL